MNAALKIGRLQGFVVGCKDSNLFFCNKPLVSDSENFLFIS